MNTPRPQALRSVFSLFRRGCIGVPLLALAAAVAAAPARPADRPNIVVILADDLAWSDLRCYGHRYHDTPNLDRLAQQGMRFTNGYAAGPLCSPSRAALLTGRSPARLHFEFVTKNPGDKPGEHPLQTPPYTLNLPLEEVTLGEVLGAAGYATGYFGKWHVSAHNQRYLAWSTTHGPRQQGFVDADQEFGSHPYGDEDRTPEEMKDFPRGDYGRDALTERALGFLRARSEQRFFLYLAHYYVHTPVRTRAKWLEEKYRHRLPAGAPERRATYAAMVETLDHHVGQVLTALDELGLTDKTLVVFASDNGGHPEYTANGPLRGNKWNLYEGGIRVPWIVRWPGQVQAGSTVDTPIIGSDLLPTLCEVAGVSPPAGVPLDGRSMLAIWRGRSTAPLDRPLVWHFPYYHPEGKFEKAKPTIGVDDFATSQTRPQSAIRKGEYKLIHFYESGRDELYRLDRDLSEQRDLAAREPAKARELRAELDRYLDSVNARRPKPRAAAAR